MGQAKLSYVLIPDTKLCQFSS